MESHISLRPIFPRLPMELVHYVFQLAAASSRHSCLDICLVASWARTIALPHLFHAIVIKDNATLLKFVKHVADDEYSSANFSFLPSSAVKGVWITASSTTLDARSLLTILRASANAIYWTVPLSLFDISLSPVFYIFDERKGPSNQEFHLTITVHDHYRMFSVFRQRCGYIGGRNRPPIFNRITHIIINPPILPPPAPYGTQLDFSAFTRLSHISVPHYLNPGLHHDVMIVVAFDKDVADAADLSGLEEWVHITRKTDDRVYLLERFICSSDDWETEMRGGESIWDRAIRYTNITVARLQLG